MSNERNAGSWCEKHNQYARFRSDCPYCEVERLEYELAALRKKTLWVSVSQSLPDEAMYVLACMSSGLVVSTFYCPSPGYFDHECGEKLVGETDEISSRFHHARRFGHRVVAWMPMPAATEGDE